MYITNEIYEVYGVLDRLIIGICDDEQKSIEITKEYCEKVSEELGIEFAYRIFMSGEEVLECDEIIDILMLDIEMNGINGIETMHELEDKDTIGNILFVSGYADYIHESFGTKTKGFICKPIEYSQVKKEIEKTITYIKKAMNKQIIKVDVGGRLILLDTENIVYIQGEGRYVRIVTNTESCLVTENIKVWGEKLTNNNIQRVHKSYLVNFKYILRVAGTEIILKDNTKLPIGRKYCETVREQYRKYLFEKMRLNGR